MFEAAAAQHILISPLSPAPFLFTSYQPEEIVRKVEEQTIPYGVDKLHIFDAEGLFPYTSKPHTSILVNLFKQEQPQICLMGATVIGRDLGPRVSSSLHSGLTTDCTSLEIGPHDDPKTGKHYDQLLYELCTYFSKETAVSECVPACV